MVITIVVYYVIHTWIKGNKALESQKIIIHTPVDAFLKKHLQTYPQRIPGTAIFLCREPFKIPSSLVMQLHHNKFLHEKVIFISLIIRNVPFQKAAERFVLEPITQESSQLTAYFGFKEIPDLNKAIHWLREHQVIHPDEEISIFLGRGIPVSSKSLVLTGFSEKLYIVLTSLAQNATDFYRIPHHKVIDLGVRYKI